MKNKNIRQALQTLRPNAQWTLHGHTFDGLIWHDTVQSRPTNDEIVAAIAAYVPPPTQEQRIAKLEAQVATLLASQNK